MKAYGYTSANADPVLFETETPAPTGQDLLIEIAAIAVNPVDTKVKATISDILDTPRIVGWDACGTVIATGKDCQLFKVGDKVFYAGDVSRPGCYASHQLVDERIVGMAPKNLSASEAAALPLTSLTAWESLFSRMRIHPNLDKGKTILIVGAAGGVGSIAIQLAKQIAELNVVATASRPESVSWCQQMGADQVINHHYLTEEYQRLNISAPDYILCMSETDVYYDQLCDLIAPQGLICFTVTSHSPKNIDVLKNKSAGIVWEFMFTRPMFNTADISTQHQILNRVSEMLDQNMIKTTLTQTLSPMNESNLKQAHQQLLSGNTIGKIALTAITTP